VGSDDDIAFVLLDPEARHVLDLGRQTAARPFEAGTPDEARRT
jgi:acetyl esterase